jgi:hypothetical protein
MVTYARDLVNNKFTAYKWLFAAEILNSQLGKMD